MSGVKKAKRFKFEEALKELEKIVERLDSGELGLDQMLEEFERGIGLVRSCKQFLDQAQQKVEMLLNSDGKLELEELKAGAEDGDEEEKGD